MDGPNQNSVSLLTPALRERLVTVGRKPNRTRWHGLSYAPLHTVAARYAAAGAEIWNIPGVETTAAPAGWRTGP
jgi:hypothetical protein